MTGRQTTRVTSSTFRDVGIHTSTGSALAMSRFMAAVAALLLASTAPAAAEGNMVGHGSGGGDSGEDCECGLSLEQNASFVGVHGWTLEKANTYACDCCDCQQCTSSTRADNVCYTCNGGSLDPEEPSCSHHWILIGFVTLGFFGIVGVGWYLGVKKKKDNAAEEEQEMQSAQKETEKKKMEFNPATGKYEAKDDDDDDDDDSAAE